LAEKNNKYELLLAVVVATRGSSFIFSKMLLEHIGSFTLLAMRFLLAFFALSLIFYKRLKNIDTQTFLSGLIVGVLYFGVMSFELAAVKRIATSTVALLENSAIIFVPLAEALLIRKFPEKTTIICSLLAMCGVALLTLHQGSFSGGIIYGMLSAAVYTVAIIVTDRLSKKCKDSLMIGLLELGTLGVLALIASLIVETAPQTLSPRHWLMLAIQALICTGFGFTLQPVAQRHISSERAGLFCAISPAMATILGALVLNEKIGWSSFLGLALILSGIVLPHVLPQKLKEKI